VNASAVGLSVIASATGGVAALLARAAGYTATVEAGFGAEATAETQVLLDFGTAFRNRNSSGVRIKTASSGKLDKSVLDLSRQVTSIIKINNLKMYKSYI
jgi:hypothetical protein